MFPRLGAFVSRHWLVVVLAWLLLLVALRVVAPRWDSVTHDGDFAFLPAEMPSVVGQRLTEEAFPTFEAKSQIVLIVAQENEPLGEKAFVVANELSKRFHNLLGVARHHAALAYRARSAEYEQRGDRPAAARAAQQAEHAWQTAEAAFNEVLRLDPEAARAWHNLGVLHERQGLISESESNREKAWTLRPNLRGASDQMLPVYAADLPLVDVWTRDNEVFGSKMLSKDRQAALVVLHLSNEFMATDNIRVLDTVRGEVQGVRAFAETLAADDLLVGISGSAAVGGDMLQSAAESIQNTETFTVILVIVILLAVYRAPLLVLVPLTTIAVSLSVSTDVLSLLTQLDRLPGFEWWEFKIFKTTKIFVVVILFGAGTDFCLFLIARFREELAHSPDRGSAIREALAGVGDALTASALTTIIGLSMMFFADYGKFRNSGPAIGICLAITLVACLTFAPAVLRGLGAAVFWPRSQLAAHGLLSAAFRRRPLPWGWQAIARVVVARPATILLASLICLSPLAFAGWFSADHVTFDLVSELEPERPSLKGNRILEAHFPVGESGPVIVLARVEGAGFGGEDGGTESMAAIQALTQALSQIDGVIAVRSLAEPLGDPPKRISLLSAAGRRKLFLREHQLTKSIFVTQASEFRNEVTRFELVLAENPFSHRALDILNRIESRLREEANQAGSFWSQAEFSFTGTTSGIRDLKRVTRSDQKRIQALVVSAVLVVLWFTLRDPSVCVYLVVSVVFSYLVTIGATELFFQWSYGDTFQGLDWKVPVFLFVILVAVGEDYNIYLVTRVFEEQSRLGPFAGLRSAIVRTGGIITSCGVIMAGTFLSMTTGTMRGIVELGFALALGVLLDTLIVRPILVPAFLAILFRWRARHGARPSRAALVGGGK